MTTPLGLGFLQVLVHNNRIVACQQRSWAPFRPSAATVYSFPHESSIARGEMIRRLIQARLFAVTSARLDALRERISKDQYYSRTIKVYSPFGHRKYADIVCLFKKTSDAFDQYNFDSLRLSVENPRTLGKINVCLGRDRNSIPWSSRFKLKTKGEM